MCASTGSIMVPVIVPIFLLQAINTIFKSKQLGKIIGFVSRSNQALDDFDPLGTTYVVEQPSLFSLLKQ